MGSALALAAPDLPLRILLNGKEGEIGLMPPEARLHEPLFTLDGGADGLDVQRRVAASAAKWLAPGGHLLVETGQDQAATTAEIFARNGLRVRIATSPELYATIVIGTRPI